MAYVNHKTMLDPQPDSYSELTEHFFRNEYGKIVAVIARYLGNENVQTAEDVVQEALLKATEHWEINGVPENPKAWLYTTAKNLTLNLLKRKQYHRDYMVQAKSEGPLEAEMIFSEELIEDSQLRMMFSCCHPSISENLQVALILKILSGFSIAEIASAFFSNEETINKRLVRGRKQLRQVNIDLREKKVLDERLNTVLKTIYLLFNEGYFPASKNLVVRFDLCLEAIRLTKLLTRSKDITQKTDAYALLALMFFNTSRFKSRQSDTGDIIDLRQQNRSQWDQKLIQAGTHYLNQILQSKNTTKYGLLATISAHHCIADSYENTNWEQILSLYDQLLIIEDSPIVRLNRIVALAEVNGINSALEKLEQLGNHSDIGGYYLYYFTMAELYKNNRQWQNANIAYKKALQVTKNERDRELLEKKLQSLVLISPIELS